ncbi:phosphotransferase [Microlunatus sp. GCM10028923]|uniref:phosphotransferase n=1 Tax=Microlunatus sp. GCM10028923 TaxID=3273400 RepID=UPI00361F8F04
MESAEVLRASEAARNTAAALGLQVSDAIVVHNSDRIALRLQPCDVLVRIAPASWRQGMEFEALVARRLAEIGSPVGELDPRVELDVYECDGFAMTFWTYYESVSDRRAQQHLGMTTSLGPADYAKALAQLHADLRQMDLTAPHVMDRVAGWQLQVEDPERTPELRDRDRELLRETLKSMSAAIRSEDSVEQLLHGEPHPGNVLDTRKGPLWIDVGTLQRGPVEYDLAYAPEEVTEFYPEPNQRLVQNFRILMWAGIATMRWNQHDQYPRRDYWRVESLNQFRTALESSAG